MRRKALLLVPTLALVMLLAGGLWPAPDPGDRSDEGLRSAIAPQRFQAQVAGAISVPFTIEFAPLRHNSRQAFYVGQGLSCEQGRQVKVRVTFAQEHGAEGWGQWVGRCTGELQPFEVRVNARGPVPFRSGDADFTGWAAEFERGRLIDEVTWSGTVPLQPTD